MMSTKNFRICYVYALIVALTLPMTAMGQTGNAGAEEFSVTINTRGIWIDSGDKKDSAQINKDEAFHITAYIFGDDGVLTVSEYDGLYTDMTKREHSYRYRFEENSLILMDDDTTEHVYYELQYHSLAGIFMILHRDGKQVRLLSSNNQKVKEMLDDFDRISKKQ